MWAEGASCKCLFKSQLNVDFIYICINFSCSKIAIKTVILIFIDIEFSYGKFHKIFAIFLPLNYFFFAMILSSDFNRQYLELSCSLPFWLPYCLLFQSFEPVSTADNGDVELGNGNGSNGDNGHTIPPALQGHAAGEGAEQQINRLINENSVVLISKTTCPFCTGKFSSIYVLFKNIIRLTRFLAILVDVKL